MTASMRFAFGLVLVGIFLAVAPVRGQTVPVIRFDQLDRMVNQPNDTLYVVNFWATWCGPCVQEIPQFEAVRRAYAQQKVRVLLVSLDTKGDLAKKVIPFVRQRKLSPRVVLLDEPDLNTWVDRMAPEWSGALPMTLLLNKHRNIRRFIGEPVKPGELEAIINQYKR